MKVTTAIAALAGLASASEVAESTGASGLVPMVFNPMPLGSIKPSGWLKDQLQLMADGLAGHEHDFYNYVAHSSWIGQNQEYSDLNEGLPYWFNGLVPLAYGLNDATLIAQVTDAANYIIENQWADGWIGPENVTERNFWARYPLFMGLTGLVEADTATWEPKVIPALEKFWTMMNTALKNNYTYYQYHPGNIYSSGDVQWGQVRSQDMMLSLEWMYENYPGNQSVILLENMKLMHTGGLPWENWYNQVAYFGQGMENPIDNLNGTVTNDNFPYLHGVNVGQGLKAVAVVRRFTHNDSLVQTAMDGVNWTMTYHGASSGQVIGDERLEGLAPYSGGEFCTAVETTFSLSYLYQALGNNYYADRAQLTAFNAMPAMATPDWWGRQYMASENQPYAVNLTEPPFWNVNSWGETFGLEPDYPCCTVNHPQGWPKFLANSYVTVGNNGIGHMLLSPGTAEATLRGGKATVICDTQYPFSDTLSYTVSATAPMDFYVRVPSWASNMASITVNTKKSALSPDTQTGMQKISLPKGTSHITYELTAPIYTQPRENDTVAVYRGSVLYALEVSNTNTSTLPKPYWNPDDGDSYYPSDYAPPQSRDWQYHNSSAWNYAIDPTTIQFHGPTSGTVDLANPLFGPGGSPGYMTVKACEIDWPMAPIGSVPDFPPTGSERKCIKSAVEVKLVPFASAKTRMTELPVLSL